MADTQVLGTCVFDVRVQVPPPALTYRYPIINPFSVARAIEIST